MGHDPVIKMTSNGSKNTKTQSLGCANGAEKCRRLRGRLSRGTDSSFEKCRWPDYCISNAGCGGHRKGAGRDPHRMFIAGTLIPNNRADQPQLRRRRRCLPGYGQGTSMEYSAILVPPMPTRSARSAPWRILWPQYLRLRLPLCLCAQAGQQWPCRSKKGPLLWRRYPRNASPVSRLLVTPALPRLACKVPGVTAKRNTPLRIWIDGSGGTTRVTLADSWSESDFSLLHKTIERFTVESMDTEVDDIDPGRIEGAFIGTLMLWYGHQSGEARGFRALSMNARAHRVFWMRGAAFVRHGVDRFR